MFRENQMECHHTINLFKSFRLKSDLSTLFPWNIWNVVLCICSKCITSYITIHSLFSSQVCMFDLYDKSLHLMESLHIYHPLHPDSRRWHNGGRVQVDHHVPQLLLDVTVIYSWYCGRAVCWNIRMVKEQEFFSFSQFNSLTNTDLLVFWRSQRWDWGRWCRESSPLGPWIGTR